MPPGGGRQATGLQPSFPTPRPCLDAAPTTGAGGATAGFSTGESTMDSTGCGAASSGEVDGSATGGSETSTVSGVRTASAEPASTTRDKSSDDPSQAIRKKMPSARTRPPTTPPPIHTSPGRREVTACGMGGACGAGGGSVTGGACGADGESAKGGVGAAGDSPRSDGGKAAGDASVGGASREAPCDVTKTMLPHLGQARIWPIAEASRTRSRALQVVQPIENPDTSALACRRHHGGSSPPNSTILVAPLANKSRAFAYFSSKAGGSLYFF